MTARELQQKSLEYVYHTLKSAGWFFRAFEDGWFQATKNGRTIDVEYDRMNYCNKVSIF